MDFLSKEFNDPSIDTALALPLVRHLCYATKEDKIPQFKKYQSIVSQLKQIAFAKTPSSFEHLEYQSSLNDSYRWIIENKSKSSPEELFQSILKACAKSFLHFDTSFQDISTNPVKDNINWLDFTHAITFANAVRKLCQIYPQYWEEGLTQMLCFLGRNSGYTSDSISESDWKINNQELKDLAYDKVLDHGLSHPIYSAHILKTTQATFEEIDHCDDKTAFYLKASLNRFLNSSMKQKYARRTVAQAIKLIGID